METKNTWVLGAMWVALLGALTYTAKTIFEFLAQLSQLIFGSINALFTAPMDTIKGSPEDLFVLILFLVMVGLLFAAWRAFYVFTTELVIVFAESDENAFMAMLEFELDEDDDDDDELDPDDAAKTLPGEVVRNLAFVWVLYFVNFILLPLIIN